MDRVSPCIVRFFRIINDRMIQYGSEAGYIESVSRHAQLPEGFSAGITTLTFSPAEKPVPEPSVMNLAAVIADDPTGAFGAVFTRNSFPGIPVIRGRRAMTQQLLQGVVINNKIANVCSPRGNADAEAVIRAASQHFSVLPERLLSFSTGIIGWSLPVQEMTSAVRSITLSRESDLGLRIAQAIMTTDSYPKLYSVQVGRGRILGIAKGAGMIEPNLATMLVFLFTDIDIERNGLRAAVHNGSQRFNAISVDGDQSTSDTVLCMSSCAHSGVSIQEFTDALDEVCCVLAEEVVRNGEGAGHLIRVRVSGAPDETLARGAGKAVVNSPLVKTAIYGADPNVGRILAALGDYAGSNGLSLDPGGIRIRIGDHVVFSEGIFKLDHELEKNLSTYLTERAMNPRIHGFPQHNRDVEIGIVLGSGPGSAEVLGTDLSHEYVRENADYRS
jgi:glutamate N-acetyltransferase / amino-acid N-acetyltransferase